ncbi:hypothetical protein ACFLZ5_06580 [Thermodesulfobacteriota bacterium]
MLTGKDAGLSEPVKAVSFQRPDNIEKHKGARRAGTDGVPFLAPSFGQAKEGDM